jgi:hypothetical protein
MDHQLNQVDRDLFCHRNQSVWQHVYNHFVLDHVKNSVVSCKNLETLGTLKHGHSVEPTNDPGHWLSHLSLYTQVFIVDPDTLCQTQHDSLAGHLNVEKKI